MTRGSRSKYESFVDGVIGQRKKSEVEVRVGATSAGDRLNGMSGGGSDGDKVGR